MDIPDASTLTREEQDIAKRWCILNAWGWPMDVVMPENKSERLPRARALMAKCVQQIGLSKCLAYWNSAEFKDMAILQVYR